MTERTRASINRAGRKKPRIPMSWDVGNGSRSLPAKHNLLWVDRLGHFSRLVMTTRLRHLGPVIPTAMHAAMLDDPRLARGCASVCRHGRADAVGDAGADSRNEGAGPVGGDPLATGSKGPSGFDRDAPPCATTMSRTLADCRAGEFQAAPKVLMQACVPGGPDSPPAWPPSTTPPSPSTASAPIPDCRSDPPPTMSPETPPLGYDCSILDLAVLPPQVTATVRSTGSDVRP